MVDFERLTGIWKMLTVSFEKFESVLGIVMVSFERMARIRKKFMLVLWDFLALEKFMVRLGP